MKRFTLINTILCFSIIATSSAQEWININPTFDPPGNYNMSSGTFVDENNGWFAEVFPGRVWHTTDSGNTWEMQKDSSSVWVYDITFVDTLWGWIVGETITEYNFFLCRTTDGGNLWEEISIPGIYNLTFFDSSTGFAGGDSIYRTTDGGESWQAQTIEPGVSFSVLDIYFVDEQYGWAVGGRRDVTDSGIILNTVDGGETWQVQLPLTLILQAVYFTNRMQGYSVGFNVFGLGVILRTIDGGTNWESNYLQSSSLNDVVFVDDSSGWVVGNHGFLWYTEDRGSTWEQVESGTNADLNRLVFMENGEAGYIFGDNNTLLRYDKTTDVEVDDAVAPLMFKLYQNYPNPFNPETVIVYELRGTVFVNLKVYDLTGKEVMTLVNKNQTGGSYQVVWNGRNKYGKEVSSGIYFCKLRADPFSQTRKMILIR